MCQRGPVRSIPLFPGKAGQGDPWLGGSTCFSAPAGLNCWFPMGLLFHHTPIVKSWLTTWDRYITLPTFAAGDGLLGLRGGDSWMVSHTNRKPKLHLTGYQHHPTVRDEVCVASRRQGSPEWPLVSASCSLQPATASCIDAPAAHAPATHASSPSLAA